MEFPCMVYQSPGDQLARGGSFKYKAVHSKEEMTNALTKGWFQNAQEAMDALNKPAEKEEIDTKQPTRAELIEKALDIGLKVDGRTSDEKLRKRIEEKLYGVHET